MRRAAANTRDIVVNVGLARPELDLNSAVPALQRRDDRPVEREDGIDDDDDDEQLEQPTRPSDPCSWLLPPASAFTLPTVM